jgi:hypothetical protein
MTIAISHLVQLRSDVPVFELGAAFGVVQQQMIHHNCVFQCLELATMEVLALLQTATRKWRCVNGGVITGVVSEHESWQPFVPVKCRFIHI